VLLNERDEVAECTSANIFAVHGENVSTPPLSAGCLPGVTRALLLQEIHLPNLTISEKRILRSDLESADEVFITSTTRDLMPVASVEGLRIRPGRNVRDRLQQAFSAYTNAYVAARVGEAEKVI
jgi:branched-chain amino acid aminotransferase